MAELKQHFLYEVDFSTESKEASRQLETALLGRSAILRWCVAWYCIGSLLRRSIGHRSYWAKLQLLDWQTINQCPGCFDPEIFFNCYNKLNWHDWEKTIAKIGAVWQGVMCEVHLWCNACCQNKLILLCCFCWGGGGLGWAEERLPTELRPQSRLDVTFCFLMWIASMIFRRV